MFWERKSFLFPYFRFAIPSRCLRSAAAGPILSLGIALTLLGLAVSDASAQQITAHNPAQDFNTLGSPPSGGPLTQPQSFQPSATSSASQTALASSIGIEEWKSQLIFAEPLLDGGVRFVFLVSPEEFKIEETVDLLAREWRPLPEDEFKMIREDNVDSRDRLTIILPKAAGKQRFLRLTPLK